MPRSPAADRLRHTPAFRALWAGSAISNTGDGIRLAALPLLAVSLTTSPPSIAGVAAAQYLPWIVFAPVGGALVDRWRRRSIIVAVQLARAAVMAALAIAVVTGSVALWQLYVAAFLITAGEILVDPATVALLPAIVGRADLDEANSTIVRTEIVTNDFVGAPLGSATFAVSAWLPMAIDASSYAASTGLFARLPRLPAPSRAAPGLRQQIGEGFRWLRSHPVLGPLTAAVAVFQFGAVAALTMLVLLVTDVLHGADATFGLLLAVGAAGALVGTLLAPRIARRVDRAATLGGALALQSILLIGVAVAPNLPFLFVVWFLLGVPMGVWMPLGRALQQRLTPDGLLGRVNTTNRMFTRGSMVVGALTAGGVAAATSVRLAIGIGAAFELMAAIAVYAIVRRDEWTPSGPGTPGEPGGPGGDG